MSAAYEPSLSSSTRRFSMSSSFGRLSLAPAGDSAINSQPSIDFGFENLQRNMSRLKPMVKAFVKHGSEEMLKRRLKHEAHVAQLQGEIQTKRQNIDLVKSKIANQQENLDKEEAERRGLEASIKSLETQRDTHLATRARLQKQMAQTEAEIAKRLAAQRKYAEECEAQSRFNVPELDFWVSSLCLRIEGAGHRERLKFVYTHIDERDWDREAWFEFDTTSHDYDVKHCKPKLERAKVERVLERVNETRQLVVLLKGMRELFVEVMRS
ncbi:hypothetical protein CDD82_7084 [Ophiocordyceps australis]|uniref:Kinetochore protein SPC25 n=1 Tax=Ophiocordyceps australis TaxID=1399860 RepID=A0A2C5YT31_9HYPO|nr:hypothetical protein CDD82_7084 [Ophiocordyceps australis]